MRCHDEVVQTACERDESLASSSTLCRFERRAERQWAVAIHQVLVEQFIASHRRAPRELVIDFDATDDPVHGHQPGRELWSKVVYGWVETCGVIVAQCTGELVEALEGEARGAVWPSTGTSPKVGATHASPLLSPGVW